jgi:hypothetical protein
MIKFLIHRCNIPFNHLTRWRAQRNWVNNQFSTQILLPLWKLNQLSKHFKRMYLALTDYEIQVSDETGMNQLESPCIILKPYKLGVAELEIWKWVELPGRRNSRSQGMVKSLLWTSIKLAIKGLNSLLLSQPFRVW